MAWMAPPAGGGAPRTPLFPSLPTPTMAPPPPLPSLEEQQQQDEAAALAISDRRTLYLLNIFIGSAARFLNSFAAVCEDKLADLHRRIVRVDSTLRLLEAKLSGTSRSSSGFEEGGDEGREAEQEHRHHPSPSSSSSPQPPPPRSPPPDRLETSSSAGPPIGR